MKTSKESYLEIDYSEQLAREKIARVILLSNVIALGALFIFNLVRLILMLTEEPGYQPAWYSFFSMAALVGGGIVALGWIRRSLFAGMVFYAWFALFCVLVMIVGAFIWGGLQRYPLIVLVFYIGILSLSVIVGYKTALPYAIVVSLVMVVCGVIFNDVLFSVPLVVTSYLMVLPALFIDYMTDSIRQSEQRFKILFQESPDLIVVVERETGIVLHVNSALERFTGYFPEMLIGKSFFDVFPQEVFPDLTEISEGQPRAEFRAVADRAFYRLDGTLIFMDLSIASIVWMKRSALLVVLRDVTGRHRAEEDRQHFTKQLRVAAELTGQINTCLNSEALTFMIENQMEQLLNLSRVRIFLFDEKSQTLVRYAGGSEIVKSYHLQDPYLVAQAAHDLILVQALKESKMDDGRRLDSEGDMGGQVAVPLVSHGKLLGVLDIQDISPNRFHPGDLDIFYTLAGQIAVALENARLFGDLQKTAMHLQGLSLRLLEVQEQERRNIACELHDEMGQMLTAIKLLLEMKKSKLGRAADNSDQEIGDLVSDLLNRIRNLSLQLRPPMLDDLGILPTLVWLFNRYSHQTQIKVNFKHVGLERRFSSQVETVIYRVIQESLTNVARYAMVDNVDVYIWGDESILRLQVDDNGVGFDLDKVSGQLSSNGLSGMQERVTLLGGQFLIDSKPNFGTHLMAEIPLQ